MFNFSELLGAGKTLRGLAGELKKNRAEQEALLQRKDEIKYAPANRVDVLAAVDGWVARQQEKYAKGFQLTMNGLIVSPSNVGDVSQINQNFFHNALTQSGSHQVHPTDVDTMLCGLFGNMLMDALHEKLAAMPWPAEEGLPLARRDPEIKKIDVQLDKLKSDESKLIDGAREAGLAID